MANSLKTNPIILDTAGASSEIARRIKVKTIVWAGDDIAAGDDLGLYLSSAATTAIIVCTAPTNDANTIIPFGDGVVFPGIYLNSMTSNHGKVFIYTDEIPPAT